MWIGLGDGFRPPRLGVGDMAKYNVTFFSFFFNITFLDFITILCHIVFYILQAV